QRRPLGRAPGIPAVIVAGPDQGPAGMSLTADIGLRGVILGIERVEVLLKPGLGRDAGVDGAADRFDGLARHGRSPAGHSPSQKNLGPDQRVPVMVKATLDNSLDRSCRSTKTRQPAP